MPYNAVALALTNVMSGEVQLMFLNISAVTPHLSSGRLRALAVTGAKRSPTAAHLPTMIESGFPNFEVSNWNAIFVPANTPPNVIAKLNAAVAKVLSSADVRERLMKSGVTPITSSAEELAAFVKVELTRWGKVVKESGARID